MSGRLLHWASLLKTTFELWDKGPLHTQDEEWSYHLLNIFLVIVFLSNMNLEPIGGLETLQWSLKCENAGHNKYT